MSSCHKWNSINRVDNDEFNSLSRKVRNFFWDNGFTETYYQNHLDVLTACENPNSIGEFKHYDQVFPLRQTNQMSLEYALLENPRNYFCFTTSYRLEEDINPGRHNTIFPMIEFEITDGTLEGLIDFEKRFLRGLGYEGEFAEIDYEDACRRYGVTDLEDREESALCKELAPVVFLKNFPERTNPFFNMKRDPSNRGNVLKVDVLLLGKDMYGTVRGMETLGSAVRSTNVDEMRQSFETSTDGEYAKTLYNKFGKERVDKELEDYFALPMTERSGCGIGVGRLLNFMRHFNLL